MKFFENLFKKADEKKDILKEARKDIENIALYEMHILGSSAEEEAAKIVEWCRVSEKKNDPSDYVDAAIALISYPPQSSFVIMQAITKLLKTQARSFEMNLIEALGNIDVLYHENDRIRSLKAKRAEIYYLMGEKPSYRTKRSAQLLANMIVSSENFEKARKLLKNEHIGKEVREKTTEELQKCHQKIAEEIITKE